MSRAHDVHYVLPTPFSDDEGVDERSLRKLVDYAVGAGVSGLLALGALGEGDRLSDAERERVTDIVLEQASGRVPVTITVTHPSTFVAKQRARTASHAGAATVMVAPPQGGRAGPALHNHFVRVADGLDVPIVIQDYPLGTGVHMPVEFIAELAKALPAGSMVKLEDSPTSTKIARLRNTDSELRIYGGLGGVALLRELEAGADGAMTGFALPAILVDIVGAYSRGDLEDARQKFHQALPLLVFEAQPGLSIGIRKEVLRRYEAIESPAVRAPAPVLDDALLAELDLLLEGPNAVAPAVSS